MTDIILIAYGFFISYALFTIAGRLKEINKTLKDKNDANRN